MASISATISLYDRITAPINNMLSALDNLCASFEQVESSMDGSFDSSQINQARQAIEAAARQTAELGNNHEDYNNQVRESTSLLGGLKGKIAGLVGAYIGMQTVKDAIGYASDLAEVQNVVDVTFGKSASSVNDWAKTTLNAFGLNEKTALQFSGTMGAMLKSSGMSGDAVMEMSKKITELSGDMASFYNLEGEEAFNKLRSGISGETEPLKQLGINMSVANLEAYAMAQGISTAYNEMSQAEQVSLRYNYLLQATADAQGDFARTTDSFSNQMKLLKENWLAFTGEIASKALPMLAHGISMLNATIGFLSANWSIIEPIVMGLVTAIGLYVAALTVYNTVQAVSTGITKLKAFAQKVDAAALMMQTGATFAATAAQHGFNAALLACPLTWIILLVIALVAVFYAVIAVINKVTDKTISATGVIAGSIATVIAFIWNQVRGLVDFVLASLEFIAKGIDALFGTNLAIKVQGWRDALPDRWAYGDAYKSGYAWGEGLGDKVGGVFGGDDSVLDNIANTAENTGKVADEIDVTNEDLKYLREIAERDVVNRFTTAEIKVDMTNNNNVSSNMDLDGIVSYLVVGVNEAMEKAAEGVHV